jgi:hypothetical protein
MMQNQEPRVRTLLDLLGRRDREHRSAASRWLAVMRVADDVTTAPQALIKELEYAFELSHGEPAAM